MKRRQACVCWLVAESSAQLLTVRRSARKPFELGITDKAVLKFMNHVCLESGWNFGEAQVKSYDTHRLASTGTGRSRL
jgi:hypothetical protein